MWLPLAPPQNCSGWLTIQLFGLRRESICSCHVFSLISDFTLCDDNRVCVLRHQLVERSRQEARDKNWSARNGSSLREAVGFPDLGGCPCDGRAGAEKWDLPPAARKRKPSHISEPHGLPRDALKGAVRRSVQALCDQFDPPLHPCVGVRGMFLSVGTIQDYFS